jgi:hypothetical protein
MIPASIFNSDALAQNAIRPDPAVDPATVVADLKAAIPDGLHDV